MLGMDRLIEIRRSGGKPELLMLSMAAQYDGLVMEGQVVVEQDDGPASVDLRPLYGLSVIVVGVPFGGFQEAERWARAACRVGARNVGLVFPTLPGQATADDGPVWIRVNGEDLA